MKRTCPKFDIQLKIKDVVWINIIYLAGKRWNKPPVKPTFFLKIYTIIFSKVFLHVRFGFQTQTSPPKLPSQPTFSFFLFSASIHEVVDIVYEGRPKRGRKLKVPKQTRSDRKRLLNTNKKHVNSKGKIYIEKVFDEQFECLCGLECTKFVHKDDRKRLFSQFWSIGTFEGRCALLMTCVTQKLKKRTYTKLHIKNRMLTRKYSIFGTIVCKKAFLRTLQISDSRVTTALRKQMYCDTYSDCRGKMSGGSNAFPSAKKDEVRAHIASFPKYVSHYTRAQTESKFLRCDLNLSKMYALYRQDAEAPVSKSFYKKIFYKDFNLRFKKPKKDTCHKCDRFEVEKKLHTGEELALIEEKHNSHIEHGESLQAQMKKDMAAAKDNDDLETLPFDMMKIMQLPKVPTSISYYKRQLNLYNFGIHVSSTGQGEFNLWLEHEASKGTQEVGSCLKMRIDRITKPIKKLILWSDSCGGQNRSIKLVLMMIYILQNHPTLQSISMRYLLSGHSFMPNDTEFGDAECALKQYERLYTDRQYMDVMLASRTDNKFVVNRMSPNNFCSVNKLEALITNRKKTVDNQKVSWLNTHEILLEKNEPSIIKMRNNIGSEFQSVNLAKYGCSTVDFKNIVLDELWPTGRPLSTDKIKDLNDMLGLVPPEHRDFYKFINVVPTADFIDDVDGFGQFVDFDME